MQYIKGIEAYKSTKGSAVTLGKFDGLHRGHQKLVECVSELGKREALNSIVCAFDMRPLYERLHQDRKMLMTKEERCLQLKEQVDYYVDCPFTESFSQMTAEDFIQHVLVDTFHAAYVVVGADYQFGHEKKGDIYMLEAYEKSCGFDLIVIEKEKYHDREISSTYVKEAIEQGDMELAQTLLGYPYTIVGTVEHGKKLGRTLGFPTFNVPPAPEKIMPPNGVYMDRVFIDDIWYDAIGNVGVKPTVTDNQRMLVESFLLGYNGNAYDKKVKIELLKFKRPEQKFSGIEEMKQQVNADIAFGREFFKNKE